MIISILLQKTIPESANLCKQHSPYIKEMFLNVKKWMSTCTPYHQKGLEQGMMEAAGAIKELNGILAFLHAESRLQSWKSRLRHYYSKLHASWSMCPSTFLSMKHWKHILHIGKKPIRMDSKAK